MRSTVILMALFCLVACGSKSRVPKGILPPEKMEYVLWDVLRSDEFLRDYVLSKDSTLNDTTETIRMYQRVFDLNKTSREEFNASFKYYKQHPVLFKEVLDTLAARGQRDAEQGMRPRPAIDTNAIRKIKEPV